MQALSPFLFGIYGRKASRRTVCLLKKTRAAGVLLLGRNIESPAQTRALTQELVQRIGRPLIFSIDHEGGWVLRFSRGVTAFPGNCALGRTGDPRLSYATGRQMALELSALGINLNLAPVVDVLTPAYNPGIGIRSFGSDPGLVGRMGAALIRGLQDHGVSACAKHFPGKGAAAVDAHLRLPTIRISRAQWSKRHLPPFVAAVKAGVDCLMTSHARFPALDKEIATFSSRIATDFVRRRLGFSGILISDDLCMGAIAEKFPAPIAARKAFEAGHDLMIIAHDENAQYEAADFLGEVPVSERLAGLLAPRRIRIRPDLKVGLRLSERVAKAGLLWKRRGSLPLPLRAGPEPLLVVFPDFSEVSDRFTFEGGPRGPEGFLRRRLSAWGKHRFLRAPILNRPAEELARKIAESGRVLFFCFEAMRFAGQKATLEALAKKASEKTVACLIRNSWDIDLLPRQTAVLDAGGYRLSQLSAALDEILS